MPLLSQPSSAARTALFYITVGALLIVWTGIWFVYLHNYAETSTPYYFCTGLCITGVTLLIIGLALGRIGRAARHAELPPPEVTAAVANVDQNAAARAPLVAPVNPAVSVAGATGAAAVPPLAGAAVVPPAAGVPAGRRG
jgi:hypothetical protein